MRKKARKGGCGTNCMRVQHVSNRQNSARESPGTTIYRTGHTGKRDMRKVGVIYHDAARVQSTINGKQTHPSLNRQNRPTTAIAGDDPGRAGNGRDPWYPNWYSNIKTPAHIILLSSVSEYKSRPYFDQWALRALSGVFGTVNCGVVTNLKFVVP